MEKLDLITYNKTDNVLNDSKVIIESAQKAAYQAVNVLLVERNWLLGKRISEEFMSGSGQDRYGKQIISELSKELTNLYGRGFDKVSIYRYVKFFQTFPEIVSTLSTQSPALSWSHYSVLIQVQDAEARKWYEKEACEQGWSVRTLQRNVSSQYYYRMLKTQVPDQVEREMKELTSQYQNKLEFIKNPVIAEFLQKFLMELGKGYAFVARQQHIHTEKEDYYIDLVFYNYILKCFVLIDLKTQKITHQDVGQMDMYVRMYDELKKQPDDNPTLGIVLCADTDEDIAKYSVLHGSEQLFATKYKLYLPSEEELKAEIQTQKELFKLQQDEHPERKE